MAEDEKKAALSYGDDQSKNSAVDDDPASTGTSQAIGIGDDDGEDLAEKKLRNTNDGGASSNSNKKTGLKGLSSRSVNAEQQQQQVDSFASAKGGGSLRKDRQVTGLASRAGAGTKPGVEFLPSTTAASTMKYGTTTGTDAGADLRQVPGPTDISNENDSKTIREKLNLPPVIPENSETESTSVTEERLEERPDRPVFVNMPTARFRAVRDKMSADWDEMDDTERPPPPRDVDESLETTGRRISGSRLRGSGRLESSDRSFGRHSHGSDRSFGRHSSASDGRHSLLDSMNPKSLYGKDRFNRAAKVRYLKNLKVRDVCKIKSIAIVVTIFLMILIPIAIILSPEPDERADQRQSFKQDLVNNNLAQEEILNDPQSFQSKAYNFVLERDILESQLYLLVALVYGLEGSSEESSKLLETNTEWCEWSWVDCLDRKNVSSVNLAGKNLDGTIISEIKDLTELRHLKLANNAFTGTMPTEIGSLKNLETLDLYRNKFTGFIPESIWNLSNLNTLYLSENVALQGTLPSTIANMKGLKILDINNCALEGSIPSEIGLLTDVEKLSLRGNPSMEGNVPTELGRLEKLKVLDLSLCPELTGPMFPLQRMDELEYLDMSYDRITGTISSDVGNATNLRNFVLGNTDLEGTIPTEFGNLLNLEEFDVDGTDVNGTVPTEFGTLVNLTIFDVSSTSVSGIVPAEFGNLTGLKKVDLCYSDIEGDASKQLCDKNKEFAFYYDGPCDCCLSCQ